jgi:predicted dehydrogenase
LSVRLAVIGVGDVAQRDYLPELPRLEGRAEAVVVCASSVDRAHDVAKRFGIPRWTTSYVEAICADDVDAVLNLTPFALHVEVTLSALAAGKHVYSEKPLALTAVDADRIGAEAEQRGLVVVAAPCVMVFPQVRRAQALLASGAIGIVHSARGLAFGGVPPWRHYISDPSRFFAHGGGPLIDMAVYPLHALTGLLGPVLRVGAFSRRTRDAFVVVDGPFTGLRVPVDVDDNWHLILDLDSGCLASVQTNNCAKAAAAPELELQGEQGTLALSLLDVAQPVRIFADGSVRDETVAHERAAGPDHLLGVAHLIDCIDGCRRPVLGVEHARHVIAVLEAAQRSAVEGSMIDVVSGLRKPVVCESEKISLRCSLR